MTYTLHFIAERLKGTLVGNPDIVVHNMASLENAKSGQITYANEKKLNLLSSTKASAAIVPDINQHFPIPVIKVKNPRLAFIALIQLFHDQIVSSRTIASQTIDATATIGERVQIDEGVVVKQNVCIGNDTIIRSNTVIGEHVSIGNNCLIHPGVVIYKDTVIGDNVIIHANAVIGADGFGYEWDGHKHVKIPHVGNVILHDEVEIGANAVIERGTLDSTVVGKGSKVGDLVEIAHNVQIGQHCIIVPATIIGGSTVVGNHVVMAGGVQVSDHIAIGDHSALLASAIVVKDVPAKSMVSGGYARSHREHIKELATLAKLPKTLKQINRRLDALTPKHETQGESP